MQCERKQMENRLEQNKTIYLVFLSFVGEHARSGTVEHDFSFFVFGLSAGFVSQRHFLLAFLHFILARPSETACRVPRKKKKESKVDEGNVQRNTVHRAHSVE